MYDAYKGSAYKRATNIDVSTWFRSATTLRARDPLAIDLDADGIETTGIPATGSPILFDHDADGIRTGTGWLKPDDAWLVLDRNANGSIDSGRELFGVDTVITATDDIGGGTLITHQRNAYNGFEALRSLDVGTGSLASAGYGDKVFDARDAAFTQVRLWRDINQDGASQPGELSTLADAGITAIGLAATATNTNLGNGNTVTGTATVSRGNASATAIDSVDLTAGNLNLGNNPFYRQFTDTIPLTAAARALPEMGGSGWLRDLREAMSLGTAPAAGLPTRVQQFAQASTRDGQLALIDALLTDWAASSGQLNTTWQSAYAGTPAPAIATEVVTFAETANNGSTKTIRYTGAGVGTAVGASLVSYGFRDADLMTTIQIPTGGSYQAVNAAGQAWLHRRNVLEAFNGQRFFSFEQTVPVASSGLPSGGGGGRGVAAAGLRWSRSSGQRRLHKRDIRPIGEAGHRRYAMRQWWASEDFARQRE